MINNWGKYLLIIALVANTAVLGGFLLRNQKPFRETRPEHVIIETLHFDAEQQHQYALLRDKHFGARDQVIRSFETNRRELYAHLGSKDTAQRNALLMAIGQGQIDMERERAEHFTAVRDLCRPDQQAQFDDLMLEVTKLFTQKPQPK